MARQYSKGKRAKKRSNKVKNYDEGVFDITKVDFNDVADKLKAGSEKLASKAKGKAQQEKAKTRKIIMLRRIIMLRQIIILR